jgi:hypothetical protein
VDKTERQVDGALVKTSLSSEAGNVRLLEPLRTCSASFARIGPPPKLLESVQDAVLAACGQAEYAVQVNDRFGVASPATTKLHLNEAEDRLALSRRNLHTQLGGSSSAPG